MVATDNSTETTGPGGIKTEEIPRQIQQKGVNYLGYGFAFKHVLLDLDLSIEDKALYSYLASLASQGNTAFPKRDTILYHLDITKKGYYPHLDKLVERGYIVIHRELAPRTTNTYTLIDNPPSLSTNRTSMLEVGYGFTPRAVMMDSRLDIRAKGLYVYLCCFTGSDNKCYPKLKHILYHLQICEPSFYKLLNELISLNYVTIDYKSGSTEKSYVLCQYPDEQIGAAEILKRVERKAKKPAAANGEHTIEEDTTKGDIIKGDVTKEDVAKAAVSNNNKSNNTKAIITSLTNPSGLQSIQSNKLKEDPMDEKKIQEDIKAQRGIPNYCQLNPDDMAIAVKHICDWKYMHDLAFWDDQTPQDRSSYELIVNALIDMSSSQKLMTLNGSRVTYRQFLDCLNQAYQALGEEPERMYLFVMRLAFNFSNAVKEYKPQKLNAYLRSFLWQRLNDTKFMDAVLDQTKASL